MLCCAVLCCAVLCCAVLCCAVLCCAVLCCAVLCCAVLCCAVLCCAVLCCAVLCCAVLCCAVLCCAVLCCAVLCCAVLCCAVLCCAVPKETVGDADQDRRYRISARTHSHTPYQCCISLPSTTWPTYHMRLGDRNKRMEKCSKAPNLVPQSQWHRRAQGRRVFFTVAPHQCSIPQLGCHSTKKAPRKPSNASRAE